MIAISQRPDTDLLKAEQDWLSRNLGAVLKWEQRVRTSFPALSMLRGRRGARMRLSTHLSTSQGQESSSQRLDSGPSVHLSFQQF